LTQKFGKGVSEKKEIVNIFIQKKLFQRKKSQPGNHVQNPVEKHFPSGRSHLTALYGNGTSKIKLTKFPTHDLSHPFVFNLDKHLLF